MQTNRTAPLVSVYIPTKNRLELLKRAIDSVLNQSHARIEIIVVDDGSTDGTRNYLQHLNARSLVKPIHMPVSVGACNARNFAINAATGNFLTGLDDDDYFEADRIRNFVAKWEDLRDRNVHAAGLYDGIKIVRRGNQALASQSTLTTADQLKVANTVGNQVFAPREHFVDAGLFDNSLPCWQDWDLWLRMARKYGDFFSCGNSSYVQDLQSTSDRISTQPGFAIRYGSIRFKRKHGPYSLSQTADFLASLCDYPQVKLHPSEMLLLAGSFRIAKLSRKIAQNVLPRSAYASLRQLVSSRS
ncbi:glycosyltransferase family 2 protein [Paraburkholderia sp. BCC1886]|uniref:glycosyltransferase family 2 protein n=1 Tax=Paraburkholderia sp. BCC1886 TaxID=2562670 RepID=UPI00118441A7|nr:glycosyltransferase [Paraburkholderia sp. BCC1886]